MSSITTVRVIIKIACPHCGYCFTFDLIEPITEVSTCPLCTGLLYLNDYSKVANATLGAGQR